MEQLLPGTGRGRGGSCSAPAKRRPRARRRDGPPSRRRRSYSAASGRRRNDLTRERCAFWSSRRATAALEGEVVRLAFRGIKAVATRARRLASTVARLRSRERSAWEANRSGRRLRWSPEIRRALMCGGRPSSASPDTISSARVSVWSRCWPPGPDAREYRHADAARMWSVTSSGVTAWREQPRPEWPRAAARAPRANARRPRRASPRGPSRASR